MLNIFGFFVFGKTTKLSLRRTCTTKEKRDCELEMILLVWAVELSSKCGDIYRRGRAGGEHPKWGSADPSMIQI